MKIDKNFALAMGYKSKDLYAINIQLTASQNKGKHTTTIVCPKSKGIPPFIIFNN